MNDVQTNIKTAEVETANSSGRYLQTLVSSRLSLNTIHNGDSFTLCDQIEAKSVDMILEDMPYNTTACKWDVKIDLNLYWETRLRILKPTGVVVLTGSQPFTSELVNSNLDLFRYEAIYKKPLPSNPLLVNKALLKYHENILVFYKAAGVFNPQTSKKKEWNRRNNKKMLYDNSGVFGNTKMKAGDGNRDFVYDGSVIEIENRETGLHPTQKPVGLFEYLIRTYTNEGDLVFDGFGGSGTTAIAAHRAKRNFIVIEKDMEYYEKSKQRLEIERAQQVLF